MAQSENALKSDLLAALNALQTTGSFAGSLPISPTSFPNPYLECLGIGPVALPLGEVQARCLIEKANQPPPLVEDSETTVDTSVRKTWEVDGSQLEMRNPAWPRFIQNQAESIKLALGLNGHVHAELDKMLIYEKGATSKAHTDLEKGPGIFGTMALCLPSPHNGGNVVVRHGGQDKVLKTEGCDVSLAFWYSDVSHEVLPVESGYRWVLTYNLITALDVTRPSASLADQQTEALRQTVQKWLESPASNLPSYLFHGLEHHYSTAGVSVYGLKSKDFIQVLGLNELSKELPIDIFLAVLEKNVLLEVESPPYDHNYYDDDCDEEDDEDRSSAIDPCSTSNANGEIETDYTIESLTDLEGIQLTKNNDFHENYLLSYKSFDLAPYETFCEDFPTGTTETQRSQITAVVIVRRDATVRYLIRNVCNRWGSLERNYLPLVEYFIKTAPNSSSNRVSSIAGLKALAKVPDVDGGSMASILMMALVWEDQKLLECIASHAEEKISFAAHDRQIALDFFSAAKDTIAQDAEMLAKARAGLTCAILSLKTLGDQLLALSHIAPPGDPVPAHVLEFAQDIFSQALERSKPLVLMCPDGDNLVACVIAYFGFAGLVEKVIPFVEEKKADTAFTFSFLHQFHQYLKREDFPKPDALDLWKRVTWGMLANMQPQMLSSPDAPRPQEPEMPVPWYYAYMVQAPAQPQFIIRPELMADFLRMLLASDMAEDLVQSYIGRLVSAASAVPGHAFATLWLPFLRFVVDIMRSHSIPFSTPQYQHLFRALLEAYTARFVGSSPGMNRSLIRQTVLECCTDCRMLNRFLRDPHKRTEGFQLPIKRQDHLSFRLDQLRRFHGGAEYYRRSSSLFVNKTFAAADQMLKDWEARRTEAEQNLYRFDQDQLKMLLGGFYERTLGMQHLGAGQAVLASHPVAVASAPTQRMPLGSLSSNMQWPVQRPVFPIPGALAGTKRKIGETEVIDLTSDD